MSARTNLKIRSVIVALVLVTAAPTFAGQIIYVDDNAAGANDGSSWPDAFNYLQDAFAAAYSGDEIHVAQGTYKPDQGAGITLGDREATFQLINGVTIKGGYAGTGTPDPNARDIELYETILTGDLLGNDIDVNNPYDLLYEPTRDDNSYNVVTGSDTDDTTVLDGFTITAGHARDRSGGGMYNHHSKPTVLNCTFTKNWAEENGGGMFNASSNPLLVNCKFTFNATSEDDDDEGGSGIFNESSSPILVDCVFIGNWADFRGGGIYNSYSNPTLTNCTFSDNWAQFGGAIYNYREMDEENGGAIYNYSPTLTNCTFSGNSADNGGGGIYNNKSSPILNNCTFAYNSVIEYGGGMYNHQWSNPTLSDCVFKGNSGENGAGIYCNLSSPSVTYCTFEENSASEGGGGIYNFAFSNTKIKNCIFINNSAHFGGGLLIKAHCEPTVTNCTFAGNWAWAGSYGGGICSEGSDSTLINCILWGDVAAEGNEIYLSMYVDLAGDTWPSTMIVSYSDIESGLSGVHVETGCTLNWGEGNIDVDPCFVDEVNGDCHLLPGSPCIDAGDPNYISEPNETDLNGKSRVINSRVDMGSYEFQGFQTLYVDADAPFGGDGTSWAAAFKYLQDALFNVIPPAEIRVAQGIYKPDQGEGITPGDRTATFRLMNGVTIKGGYAGLGQTDPNARDVELYETILTGDLDGNDVAVNDPEDLLDEPTRAENSFHVVTGSGTDATAILDGFTITAGNANGPLESPYISASGGGMYNNEGGPTVTNCTFSWNSAGYFGAGMYNRVPYGVPYDGTHPTLINCTFNRNSANAGGGIYNSSGGLTAINCIFSFNFAEEIGGGLGKESYREQISPAGKIVSCTFYGNFAGRSGSALANHDYSDITITNSILWGNPGTEIYIDTNASTKVQYSCVEGYWPGEGNIDADPCFVDAANGDYHLLPGSPCVDAGDPNYVAEPNETDLDGKPRVMDGNNDGLPVIDMGAYEYQRTIPTEARIVPRTINLSSEGRWITCYIWPPEDYDVADIDPNSVFLEGIKAESVQLDEEKQVAIAKFDREDVQDILTVGEIGLTITGQLTDGTVFEGTDVIRVINKAGGKSPK